MLDRQAPLQTAVSVHWGGVAWQSAHWLLLWLVLVDLHKRVHFHTRLCRSKYAHEI